MMLSLIWFEIKRRIFKVSSIIHFIVFVLGSFFMAITFAGAFKGVGFSLGFSSKLSLNAPVVLHAMIGIMNYFALFIVAPIFGQAIVQDFENGYNKILFATPIRKTTYFLIRFSGAFFSSLLILSGIGIGLWLASLMPFIEAGKSIQFSYLLPYCTIVIPNIFAFGVVFLAIASLSKKMASVYVASIVLFSVYMIAQNLTGDLENRSFASLIDPFGLEASYQMIRYWTVSEQSSQLIPFSGVFLWNRIIWMAISQIVLAFGYICFDPFSLHLKKKLNATKEIADLDTNLNTTTSDTRSIKVFLLLALSEFKQAFSNIGFIVILLSGVLYIFAVSGEVGKIYGTETFPVTYHVLEVVGATFSTFVIIILSYYAGELVWKDREQRVYGIIDSKPVSDLYMLLSKFFSLILLQFTLVSIILISCVLIQVVNGYYNFEWGIYGKQLMIFEFTSWTLYSVFALFIHTISKNKQVGHTIFVTTLLLFSWLPIFGFDHRLYLFGILPQSLYSDMNQFGGIFHTWSLYTLYWSMLHLLLFVLTLLFWRRGEITAWKDRLSEVSIKTQTIHKSIMVSSLVLWIGLGSYIFYNTNTINVYKTKTQISQERADYERLYKPYQKIIHPKLVSVSVKLDLFPEKLSFKGSGTFEYENSSETPVRKVLINVPEDSQKTILRLDRMATLIEHNQVLGVQVYEFAEPLKSGERVSLEFDTEVQPKGFTNDEFSKKIVENGTFFYGTDFFPTVGYVSRFELEGASTRKKFGLPEKPGLPNVDDPIASQTTYLSDEGNWIDFEATISTSLDQIALAPGTLQKEWEQEGRRYFNYKTGAPILPCYAFTSGRYEVYRDQWNDVVLEIYHHPSHTQNLARMMDAMKKSLSYYTQNFSPYQFKELRIVEFPRYTTMAQSFPTIIPYSESLGFIAKVDPTNPEDIDYPFYVTAHEVAHQWWGHQVVGGKVQGATMLSESLAQYSALMVMEKEYGPQQMKKFLKYELDQYLHGRSCEHEKELPLVLNENQSYIHYQKGSLAFYSLKDHLGEKVLNDVLRNYIQAVSFQKPPFTKAVDLVQRFKSAAPLNMQGLIVDLFETITLYENRIEKASMLEKPNHKFEIQISTLCRKWRADEQGNENEVPMDDLVDIGIFDEAGELKYLQKHKVQSGNGHLILEVEFKPLKVGIDPLNKLIDKNPGDKIIAIQTSC